MAQLAPAVQKPDFSAMRLFESTQEFSKAWDTIEKLGKESGQPVQSETNKILSEFKDRLTQRGGTFAPNNSERRGALDEELNRFIQIGNDISKINTILNNPELTKGEWNKVKPADFVAAALSTDFKNIENLKGLPAIDKLMKGIQESRDMVEKVCKAVPEPMTADEQKKLAVIMESTKPTSKADLKAIADKYKTDEALNAPVSIRDKSGKSPLNLDASKSVGEKAMVNAINGNKPSGLVLDWDSKSQTLTLLHDKKQFGQLKLAATDSAAYAGAATAYVAMVKREFPAPAEKK